MVLSEDMLGSASSGMIIPANGPRQAGLMRTSGIGKIDEHLVHKKSR